MSTYFLTDFTWKYVFFCIFIFFPFSYNLLASNFWSWHFKCVNIFLTKYLWKILENFSLKFCKIDVWLANKFLLIGWIFQIREKLLYLGIAICNHFNSMYAITFKKYLKRCFQCQTIFIKMSNSNPCNLKRLLMIDLR